MTALRRLIGLLLLAVLLALPGLAAAQLTPEKRDYYEVWLDTAERAEQVVDVGRASNAALEKLRAEIVEFREVFAKARDKNGARIKTLESQLSALGPPPENDGEEPPDIAALRNHLQSQLDELRVPRVVSEEAHNRANGLIGEIDRIIRERQTGKLLSRGPSPLNPEYWPVAIDDLTSAWRSLVNETKVSLRSDALHERVREHLLAITLLVAIGLVLIIRGGRWSEKIGDYLRNFGGRGTGVWSFVVSLARIFLPLAGTLALVEAISLTGMLGLRGLLLLEALPKWAAILLVFNWIAGQLFSERTDEQLVPVFEARRVELHVHVELLAVMLVAYDWIGLFEQIENISEGSRAVISFPFILCTALILLRLQRIRLRPKQADPGAEDHPATAAGFSRLVEIIRRGAYFLGIVSPVLAAVGYVYMAEALVYPAVMTLAILSAILILQRFLGDLYAWISGRKDSARDSLFTVLAGFVLGLLSLPLLALVWGARVADLTEVWAKFLDGFTVGDTTISPTNFIALVAIFAVGYMATRLLQSGLRNSLLPKTGIDPGGQNAIVSGTGYVGIFLAGLLAVTGAGLNLSSLAIVAGALSVGIGFGLQTIVSNFVSGIILLVERPISKGDWISVGGMMGYVRDISVRSTRIETFDRTDVIVPNSDLISGTVTNYTRGNTVGRVIVPVGVAYGTDTRLVEKILREVAEDHPMVLANPAPGIVFQGFGADSLDFEIRAILRDVNWMLSVKSDMNHAIAERFTAAGIEIPFAQRDIWLRNPEALRPQDHRGPPEELGDEDPESPPADTPLEDDPGETENDPADAAPPDDDRGE
ncbi:DUF3772 domain-containing protein [Seohaeicola saemankumensis]|nr:DUF3772 domain-containing protein [Seohaeicola saemankumensis]MCA0872178.1 DUF3772 domain-containing protein [Seohaeicola saemankumensis]